MIKMLIICDQLVLVVPPLLDVTVLLLLLVQRIERVMDISLDLQEDLYGQ